MKDSESLPPLDTNDPTTDAEKNMALRNAIDEAARNDPTRFTTRSFAVLWNEGHSIRLINRNNARWAISIPWDEIPALQAILNGTRSAACRCPDLHDAGCDCATREEVKEEAVPAPPTQPEGEQELIDEIRFIGDLLDAGSRRVCFDRLFNLRLNFDESLREPLRQAMENDARYASPPGGSEVERFFASRRAAAPVDIAAPKFETINRFRDLPQGWDSYNGSPIHPEAVEIALLLAPALHDWQPIPRSDGGIQFEKGDYEISIDTSPVSGVTAAPKDDGRCPRCGRLMSSDFDPDAGGDVPVTVVHIPIDDEDAAALRKGDGK